MSLTEQDKEIVLRFFDQAGEEMAKGLGKPGWAYRDLPNMLPEYMDQLLDWVGSKDYEFITFSERVWPDGHATVRGQVLISPEGMDRLKDALKKEVNNNA